MVGRPHSSVIQRSQGNDNIRVAQVSSIWYQRTSDGQSGPWPRIENVVDPSPSGSRMHPHWIIWIRDRSSGAHGFCPAVEIALGHCQSFWRIRTAVEITSNNPRLGKPRGPLRQLNYLCQAIRRGLVVKVSGEETYGSSTNIDISRSDRSVCTQKRALLERIGIAK